MHKKLVFGALALAAVFTSQVARADDIVIGAALPLSGQFAAFGEDDRLGIDIATQQINDNGGLLGRQVRVDYDDTASDRSKAAAVFSKFGARPEVSAIFTFSTPEFVAVDPLATQYKVPHISVGSAGAVPQMSDYSFRTMVIVNKVMDNVIGDLKKLKNLKTVAILYDTTNNYEVSEMEAVKAAAAKNDLQVVDVETSAAGDQNFTLQLTKIAQAKPDLLVISVATNEAVPVIQQARSIGITATIFGGAGLNDPRIGQQGGAAAVGTMTYFPFDANDTSPVVQEFVKRFKEKTGKDVPSAPTATAYDSMMLLAEAIKAANSSDRDAIRQALGSLKGVKLAANTYTYSGNGDNVDQHAKLFAIGEDGMQHRVEQ